MKDRQLEKDANRAKSDVESVIDTLIVEIDELENRNEELEKQVEEYREEIQDLKVELEKKNNES